jgi:hypothetical protein
MALSDKADFRVLRPPPICSLESRICNGPSLAPANLQPQSLQSEIRHGPSSTTAYPICSAVVTGFQFCAIDTGEFAAIIYRMKAYELPVRVTPEGNLEIPERLRQTLPAGETVRVIVLVPDPSDADEQSAWAA